MYSGFLTIAVTMCFLIMYVVYAFISDKPQQPKQKVN